MGDPLKLFLFDLLRRKCTFAYISNTNQRTEVFCSMNIKSLGVTRVDFFSQYDK